MVHVNKCLTTNNMAGYDYLIKFFKEEGFRYEDNGSVLSFKIQGVNYLAFKNDNTPFLQILIGCNTDGQSRSKQLEICNSMNQDKFVLKFTVNSDSNRVICSYEFEPNASTTSEDFMAAFAILDKGTDEFFERISK